MYIIYLYIYPDLYIINKYFIFMFNSHYIYQKKLNLASK